jgi:AAA15 family ATPase/GTPase
MDSHFLTDIDIIDFKCFQNFSAKGFKRVNLIGGKNNIGKTAFMEACYINVFTNNVTSFVFSLIFIKFMREKANLVAKNLEAIENRKTVQSFLDFIKCYSTESNLNKLNYEIKELDGKKEYQFDINGKLTVINANDLHINNAITHGGNIGFMDSFGVNNDLLLSLFTNVQRHDKETKLNECVSCFDSNIAGFKVIGTYPVCKVDNQYRDLSEFGDGLKHYISIICALYSCENGYLFIDEIDNGIYYDQLDRLWEIILTISKETNCQVFATTHSKEMIESFARVSQKLNEQDISYTTLVKNDKNEVKALVQSYGMFMYSMNSNLI